MDTNMLSFLNALFLGRKGKDRKYVYICSPLRSDTQFGININMRAARVYMTHVIENMDYGAKAPHAFLPEYLDDNVPAERAMALRYGLKVLEQSDMMFVCGDRMSVGMRGEIVHAVKLGIPITVFSRKLYIEVCEAVKECGGNADRVMHDMLHPILSLSATQLFDSGYIKPEGGLCFANSKG